jgi:hypothetical protein
MSTETILYGLVPAGFAIVGLALTGMALHRGRVAWMVGFSVIAVPLYVYSLLLLYEIFIQGAWPTYIAHMMIAVAFFITIAQLIVASKQRSDA